MENSPSAEKKNHFKDGQIYLEFEPRDDVTFEVSYISISRIKPTTIIILINSHKGIFHPKCLLIPRFYFFILKFLFIDISN